MGLSEIQIENTPVTLSDMEDDFPILELILRNYLGDEDIIGIRKAYFFAYEAHKEQTRANGDPYISHPLAVAEILAGYQLDASTIMAGLLHDILEDTDYTYDDLKSMFGEDTANLVQGVTKVSEISSAYHSEEEIENLRRMLVATAKDLHVIVIKLADRLHNMRTLHFLPHHKQIRISQNTLNVYSPLAHRLGLGQIKWELEDLCLMFLNPKAYKGIKNKVSLKRLERETIIKEARADLEKILHKRGIHVTVEGRAKHFYSIYMKMRRYNKSFKEIYDLIALRVICENIGDCYAVLGEVHTMWRQVDGRFKDYISTPKLNNYRSIHTTVLSKTGRMMEIQIRTQKMHQIAEHGIAAHWRYKEHTKKRVGGDSKWVKLFNQELPDTRDPEDFLQTIRNELFSDEVYVYSPKGELIRMPKDSTPVDFAYKIHTELGHQCGGAKVNGRLVPLNYCLQTGDVVSIMASKNNRPSSAWLEFIKTSSARNKIRRFLLEDRRDELLRRGRSTLSKEIQRAGYNPREFYNSADAEEIAQSLDLKKVEDIFVNIGFGRISTKQVIARLQQKNKVDQPQKLIEQKSQNIFEEENTSRSIVKLAEIDDIMYRIARCCSPLPGDNIVGFVTRGRGVTIHKTTCRSIRQYNGHPERLLPLFWSGDQTHPVSVRIEIRANDRRNLLSDLSQMISSTGTNILNCVSESVSGSATFTFILEIVNTNHLNTISQQLYGINGVKTVRRLRMQQSNTFSKKKNGK